MLESKDRKTEPAGGDKADRTERADPTLLFTFNSFEYSLPCKGLENKTLREALDHVRSVLNLPPLVALDARIQSSTVFLDQKTGMAEVLSRLGGDKHLELSINNIGGLPGAKDPKDTRVADAADLASGGEETRTASELQVGEVRTYINIEAPDTVYRPKPEGKVLIDRYLLPMLHDHLKNDLRATWVNRICGALLGASITIGVTLSNSSLPEMFRSNLRVAFFFCVIFLLALAVIEKFSRPKQGKSLENMIGNLMKDTSNG